MGWSMPRWKELPDSLDERVRKLIIQLRRLKDRSGLSLVSLESKTGYSRASWERYFNGKALPPRQAVEALARVVGTEPTQVLVLHEMAEQAWQQREARSPAADVQDGGGQAAAEERRTAVGTERPPGVRRPIALAAVVAAALVGMGAGMLIAAPWGDDDGGDGKAKTSVDSPRPSGSTGTATEGPGPYVYQLGKTYPCDVRRSRAVGGGLTARYSTTRTAILAGPGWDVVEAQCLLRHHKVDPGVVDGIYGQQTIAAVVRLQKKAGLPEDGIVGPDTWQVLRK